MAGTDIFINFFSDAETGATLFSFGGATPQPVEGLEKLLMQWLKALFTERGTDLYDDEYGTMFPRLLGAGVASVVDTFDIVSLSIEQATDSLRAKQQNQSLAPEERFGAARLQDVQADEPDGINIAVFLENEAGQALLVRINNSSSNGTV